MMIRRWLSKLKGEPEWECDQELLKATFTNKRIFITKLSLEDWHKIAKIFLDVLDYSVESGILDKNSRLYSNYPILECDGRVRHVESYSCIPSGCCQMTAFEFFEQFSVNKPSVNLEELEDLL